MAEWLEDHMAEIGSLNVNFGILGLWLKLETGWGP
jgi:hypothetical protein